MIKTILFLTIVSFLVSFISAPFIIKFLKSIGMTVKDAHKINKPLIPRSAGWIAFAGTFATLSGLIFIQTFIYQNTNVQIIHIFAVITTLLLITLAGFMDDLTTIKDKADYKSEEKGGRLKQWQKPLLILPAIIPLMIISAGTSTMNFPFFGDINFGILYPLILVPVGIFGAANMVNMLEGLNGMGSGMGIIYTGMLGLYSIVNQSYMGAILSFSVFGSLLALWHFHKTPAKILAGDSLTYFLGASLACIAILGNIEKAVLICSIPFFIEFILKSKARFKKDTIGYVDNKNKVHSKWKGIHSLPHIWMREGRFTEHQIVIQLMLVELFFSLLIWFV
jgi:UDP-N-acetylglucosamine--dolichyl-phosphate N-acetylglucosaminephosphotransferase